MNTLIKTEYDKKNFELIEDIVQDKIKTSSLMRDKEFVSWVKEKTPLLQDGKHNFSTMLYWILRGFTDFPPCAYASKHDKCENSHGLVYTGNVRSLKLGYVGACCINCKHMTHEKLLKTGKTCMERYGAESYFKTEKHKTELRAWLDEHGVENSFQLEEIKQKSNETRLRKYGYEYTMQSPEKRELAKENYRKKTGYDHQFKDPSVQKKIREAMKEVDQKEVRKAFLNTFRRKYYEKMLGCETIPNFTLEEFQNTSKMEIHIKEFEWKCTKCGEIFKSTVNYNNMTRFGSPARCLKCHPFIDIGISTMEIEFSDYIKSIYGGPISISNRSVINPYELDVFIPEKKLAFEFDGLFWHSDAAKPDDYHVMKTEMCLKSGIQLIHVFEDEWLEKNDIVKSRICNLFGLYEATVFARNCSVVEISNKESKKFQETNHIQGGVNSKVSVALVHNDQVVSLMTFGKSRFNKNYEWELLRFCNKMGYHVPGAASRLLRHFEMRYSPKSIISYADRRWSIGNLYEKLGFVKIGISKPNYFYVRAQKRYSRLIFQKHKLKDVLERFDPGMSEVENMYENGFCRIFDCGNLVFSKMYNMTKDSR